jgi:hypothetical protein
VCPHAPGGAASPSGVVHACKSLTRPPVSAIMCAVGRESSIARASSADFGYPLRVRCFG